MKVATSGESQLDYLLPGVRDAITRLRDDARALGILTYVPDYGGARTQSIVAQLISWRDEAVRKGEPFYRVSPFDKGKHGVGGACDLKVGKWDETRKRYTLAGALPPGMTEAQAYARMGALCGTHGLVWGGTFPPPADPYHFESHQTRAQLEARWLDWIASPDFPSAPGSGAVAIGAANWQLFALLAALLLLAGAIHQSRKSRA